MAGAGQSELNLQSTPHQHHTIVRGYYYFRILMTLLEFEESILWCFNTVEMLQKCQSRAAMMTSTMMMMKNHPQCDSNRCKAGLGSCTIILILNLELFGVVVYFIC